MLESCAQRNGTNSISLTYGVRAVAHRRKLRIQRLCKRGSVRAALARFYLLCTKNPTTQRMRQRAVCFKTHQRKPSATGNVHRPRDTQHHEHKEQRASQRRTQRHTRSILQRTYRHRKGRKRKTRHRGARKRRACTLFSPEKTHPPYTPPAAHPNRTV